MPICPVAFMSFANGIFQYQALDCCTQVSSIILSATSLQCGCSSGNPDCTGGWPCPEEALLPSAPPKTSRKGGPVNARAQTAKAAQPGDPVVDPHLALNGLTATLPAGFEWKMPNATFDPTFQGNDAYHVVKLDGRDRYIRVIRATTIASSTLFCVTWHGKTPRLTALPAQEVCLGQESDLPTGLKPRPMKILETPTPGGYYHRVQRSGAGADPTLFHAFLKK
jgi:hypothetical protein